MDDAVTKQTLPKDFPYREVIVGQTLHGYSEGHSLLTKSNNLSKAVQRIMLLLSDMSGPSMVSGFEEYFTGYPLLEIGMYAFAKTWYAPEMSRPGCVWTHTLLIEMSDLACIRDLRTLLKLFVRPQEGQSLSSYKSQLSVDTNAEEVSKPREFDSSRDLSESVLAALYDTATPPVFLPAEDAKLCEDLVLTIWNQQWPSLRGSFLFSTGSLSNRKINGIQFDIQVIPHVILNQLKRELPGGKFLDIGKAIDSSAIPDWAAIASRDLIAKNEEPVRHFLWAFGPEVSAGRKVFARLVQTFVLTREITGDDPLELRRLIRAVTQWFPAANDVPRLKAAMFGLVEDDDEWVFPEFSQVSLLQELVTTPEHRAFDARTLGIEERGKNLWISEPEVAERLAEDLAKSTLNPLGEQLLAGIAQAVEVEDLIRLSSTRSGLLYIFVNRNPRLAGSPSLWRSFPNEQRELFEAFAAASSSIPNAIREEILTAMLQAGVDGMAEDMVRLFGEHILGAVLDWFDSLDTSSRQDLQTEWRQSLQRRPLVLLNWLDSISTPRDASIALVASLLDPHSSEVHRFETKTWLRFVKRRFSHLDQALEVNTMAFLLALGFDNPGPRSYELVAQAFGTVYNAAERNELPERGWLLLKDQVPSLSWWRNWDKCERLRRALAERFARHKWPARYFLQIVRREDVLDKIVSFSLQQGWGQEFVSELWEECLKRVTNATDDQRRLLSHYR